MHDERERAPLGNAAAANCCRASGAKVRAPAAILVEDERARAARRAKTLSATRGRPMKRRRIKSANRE